MWADVRKALHSVYKLNLAVKVVVWDGGESYTQYKATGGKTRSNYEDGQCVMYLRLPAKEEAAREETKKVLKGNRFTILATESEEVFARRA